VPNQIRVCNYLKKLIGISQIISAVDVALGERFGRAKTLCINQNHFDAKLITLTKYGN
jgi:hypothetical protein